MGPPTQALAQNPPIISRSRYAPGATWTITIRNIAAENANFGLASDLTHSPSRKTCTRNSSKGNHKVELHNRPALCNRPWNDPPANSTDHLVYLAVDDHAIETRVRGIGAQRSDHSNEG